MPWKKELWISERRVAGRSKTRHIDVLFIPAFCIILIIFMIIPQELKLLGLIPFLLFFIILSFSGFFNPYNSIATVDIVEKDGKQVYHLSGKNYISLDELLETITWEKTT